MRRITAFCESGMPFVALFLLLAFTWPVYAQSVVTDDQVNQVAKGMYCPVCESEPLDTCATQACADWRAEIRVQLEAGRTQDEIYDDFVARYGERVLAQPSSSGLNLILWLGIPIGLLVGGTLFYRYLRQIRQPEAVTEAAVERPAGQSDDVYMRQIEEELGD